MEVSLKYWLTNVLYQYLSLSYYLQKMKLQHNPFNKS